MLDLRDDVLASNVNLCACMYKVENHAEDPYEVLMTTTMVKVSGNSFQPY